MRTAIDSSVLLDVFGADTRFGEASRTALRSAYDAGSIVACEVVWAEVRAHFGSDEDFDQSMATVGVQFVALSEAAAREAGARWSRRRQRRRTGTAGARPVADYLIGVHALYHADALLTRDRGFFGRDFEGLQVIDPSR